MTNDGRVTCPVCGSRVAPHLRFRGGGWLTYRRRLHLCRVCGTVMYESGGGVIRDRLVAVLLLLLAPGALVFVLLIGAGIKRNLRPETGAERSARSRAGLYRAPDGTLIRLTSRGDRLDAEAGGRRGSLVPQHSRDGEFVADEYADGAGGFTGGFRFERDADGRATALVILRPDGKRVRAEKLD